MDLESQIHHFVQVSQQSKELLEQPVEDLEVILGSKRLWGMWNVCGIACSGELGMTQKRKVHVLDLMRKVQLGYLDIFSCKSQYVSENADVYVHGSL
jgi:hypothetical protein